MPAVRACTILLAALLGWPAAGTYAQLAPPWNAAAGEEFLFWIDGEDQSIYRGQPDASLTERILTPQMPMSIAVAGADVIWMDELSGSILRRTDETSATDTLTSGLAVNNWEMADLEVAAEQGWMFWTGPEDEQGARDIHRAGLDGSGEVAIIEDTRMSWTVDLALHPSAERIYWIVPSPDSNTDAIYGAAFDGSDAVEVVAPEAQIRAIAVDEAGDRLFWAELGRIMRVNLDGSDPIEVVSSTTATSLTIETGSSMLYWHDRETMTIQRTPIFGGPVEAVVTDLPPDAELRDLYIHDGRISFLVRDWTTLSSIFAHDFQEDTSRELVAGFSAPAGLAVDPDDEHLYWTDSGGKILRARFDGTAVETLRWGRCGMGALTELAIDTRNRHLYWGEIGDCGEGLHRVALDDPGGPMKSYSGPYGVSTLALDPLSQTTYYVDTVPEAAIHRIHAAGTGRVTIRHNYASSLAPSSATNSLFWTDCFEGRIARYGLDGGNAEHVHTGLDCPFGLVLDSSGEWMYWSERGSGRILKSLTDGSEEELVFDGLHKPTALAATFDHATASIVEDTLDWKLYYPLEVGNVWEYVREDLYSPTSFQRVEIAGDTTILGRAYFIQVEEGYDSDSLLTFSRSRYLRYDDDAHTIMDYDTRRQTESTFRFACDLSAPFHVSGGYTLTCPLFEGNATAWQVAFSGGYTDSHLRVGRDSIAFEARKLFCMAGPCDEYFHGIGVPGWMEEGGFATASLVYARLGGREYGASITATSIDTHPPGLEPERPQLSAAPNPHSGDAVIRASTGRPGRYELAVYDVAGRRIAQLDLFLTPEQPRLVRWPELGRSLPAGVYFIRLSGEAGASDAETVVLVK